MVAAIIISFNLKNKPSIMALIEVNTEIRVGDGSNVNPKPVPFYVAEVLLLHSSRQA